jgi:hypothetical protein
VERPRSRRREDLKVLLRFVKVNQADHSVGAMCGDARME